MKNLRIPGKPLKAFIKIAGSLLALYILYTQIDLTASMTYVLRLHPGWAIVAFVTFNGSQFISARRLHLFFRQVGLSISQNFNLRLYYIGMFYNLLLPGGIGGDAFKAYLLKKRFGIPYSDLAKAILADRASGLIAIMLLISLLLLPLHTALPPDVQWLQWLAWLAFLAGPVLFFFIFKPLWKVLPASMILSMLIQLLQMAAVVALIYGLNVQAALMPYLLIFLASSVATIIPVTVGGLGLREIVFLYGARYFELDPEISVSVSLLFFLITVLSSLPGLAIHMNLPDADRSATESS